MYNWRLLLLAFFAVFQPIASFAERNLVDGRQQCCDHRLQRDSTYSLYGDNRFKYENRRINDQRFEISDVRRDERQNAIRVSAPEIDTSRNSYRERESPESRRTELHRERASRREVRDAFVTAEQRAKNYRVTDTATDRIRNAEIRRDNRFNPITDETRIFRTRNIDENLDLRNLERRGTDSRRETKLMRDYVDTARRIRNIRETHEEHRRTRDSITRTDRLRALDNQRNTQDESLDRRASATRFVLRTQRSVRSLDRLSKGSNDNRRLSFENFRIANQESENRDVRARERDDIGVEAERRNIVTPVRERSEVDREIGSRFTATRQKVVRNQRSVRSTNRLSKGSNDVRVQERDEVRNAERRNNVIRFRERPEVDTEVYSRFLATRRAVLRNQRNVRSLDRLSTGSHDDKRLSFDSIRISKQERDMRERDEVRNEVQRKNIVIRVRDRSEVDREIGSRLTTQQFVLRNQRSVRSLDRLSRESNDERKLSFENVRIAKQERDNREYSTNSRDARARERRDVRDEVGRRNIEIRARGTFEVDREIGSRFLMSRRVDNNREQRFSVNSRRNDGLRISANFGDQAYQIIRQRSNEDGNRSDRSLSRKRNDYDRRSVSQFVARTRMDASREQTNERITRQMRNIRKDLRDKYRNNKRDSSLEYRHTREITGKRLSQSETNLFENNRAHRSLNSREREINENRRTVDDRVVERIQNQRMEFREQREHALRTRDEGRASRRIIERTAIRAMISSEQRYAREVQRRVSETRNFRIKDNESQFRATSELSLTSRIFEKENTNTREDVRNLERRETRDSNAKRDLIRNIIASKTIERQNTDSRMRSRNSVNTFDQKRVENENVAYEKWHNLIYTMQAIYLCSILIPMFMNNNNDKKKAISLGLWTHFQKLVKTD